jgi:hypothetical protein
VFCPQIVNVICVDRRTKKEFSLYSNNLSVFITEECLLRGTIWVFKSGKYTFVLKGLKTRYIFWIRAMVQAIAAGTPPLRPAFKPKPLHVRSCYCNRLFSEHSGSVPLVIISPTVRTNSVTYHRRCIISVTDSVFK